MSQDTTHIVLQLGDQAHFLRECGPIRPTTPRQQLGRQHIPTLLHLSYPLGRNAAATTGRQNLHQNQLTLLHLSFVSFFRKNASSVLGVS